jgi:hypothetical protein
VFDHGLDTAAMVMPGVRGMPLRPPGRGPNRLKPFALPEDGYFEIEPAARAVQRLVLDVR